MFEEEFPLEAALVHLNHAAVSPWPLRTVQAVRRFAEENARWGSLHYLRWAAVEKSLRGQLKRLINARSESEIGLLKSTSEALSVVAFGLDWQVGDNVVITDQEFPSNRVVWEALAPRGVETRKASLLGDDPEAAIEALCDDRTRLVSVSSVQFGTGFRLDLRRIGRFCEQHEILFCVDAIQSLGAIAMDVREIRADFVMADGHKWMLGPEGLALFYCRRELLDRLQLNQYGWRMLEHEGDFDRPEWEPAHSARRFECGSPNMTGIHALHASLSLLEEVGMQQVEQRVRENARYIVDALKERSDHYELITDPDPHRHAGIVTFRPRNSDSSALFERLRHGCVLCAQRGGGVRFSPHFHTSKEDIERAFTYL